jgi:aminoglycoside phosphotransferase (APT) family kinase protein
VGDLVVKVIRNPHVAAGEPWRTRMLASLAARGFPVAERFWHGSVDDATYAIVERRVPGRPLATMDSDTLDSLLALVELQRGVDLDLEGSFDAARWIRLVLFDGWEGWADAARRGSGAAADVCDRVDRLVAPARDVELEPADFVHHDLNLSNVLVADGRSMGVVDWEGGGFGPRAVDLACPLFECERLRLADAPELPRDASERILARFAAAGGDAALRLTVAYRAVAVMGVTAARGEQEWFDRWTRTAAAVLARLGV